MEFDDLHSLRGVDPETDAGEAAPELTGEPLRGAGIAPNPVTELVADLLETTGLIPSDRLSQARSRAGTGSLAQALV